MKIQIQLARSRDEMEQIFRLRHAVYVDQDGYFKPREDRRISDRFDGLQSSFHIIALDSGRVIGGARYTQASPAGLSSDAFFDFAPHIPLESTVWGSGSMLCVSKEFRGTPVAQALLNMGYGCALRYRWTHMVTVANPKVELLFRRNGWQSITPTQFNREHNLPFVAMMIDLEDFRPSLRRIAQAIAAQTEMVHELEIERLPNASDAR